MPSGLYTFTVLLSLNESPGAYLKYKRLKGGDACWIGSA